MNKQAFLIGKPRKHPDVLIKVLKDFFMNVTLVEAAYIAQIFNPSVKEPPHLTIGLITNGDLKSIAADLNEIIKPFVDENEFIDVVDISAGDMKDAFSNLSPFYISGKKS